MEEIHLIIILNIFEFIKKFFYPLNNELKKNLNLIAEYS